MFLSPWSQPRAKQLCEGLLGGLLLDICSLCIRQKYLLFISWAAEISSAQKIITAELIRGNPVGIIPQILDFARLAKLFPRMWHFDVSYLPFFTFKNPSSQMLRVHVTRFPLFKTTCFIVVVADLHYLRLAENGCLPFSLSTKTLVRRLLELICKPACNFLQFEPCVHLELHLCFTNHCWDERGSTILLKITTRELGLH